MKIKTTITVEHTLPDSEIARFKEKVLEYIEEEIETTSNIPKISDKAIEEFLSEAIPVILEQQYAGYDRNSGIIRDTYFGTISLDYYGEDARDLVQQMAELILAD